MIMTTVLDNVLGFSSTMFQNRPSF